jgi:hypothetical protein
MEKSGNGFKFDLQSLPKTMGHAYAVISHNLKGVAPSVSLASSMLGPQKSDVLFQDANIETGGGGRKVLQMYQEMV